MQKSAGRTARPDITLLTAHNKLEFNTHTARCQAQCGKIMLGLLRKPSAASVHICPGDILNGGGHKRTHQHT